MTKDLLKLAPIGLWSYGHGWLSALSDDNGVSFFAFVVSFSSGLAFAFLVTKRLSRGK